jgi:uncharacterized coiled-coil protein SlyX
MTALERCKLLNDATKEGFDKVFQDIEALRSELVETQEVITVAEEALKLLIESFRESLKVTENKALPESVDE